MKKFLFITTMILTTMGSISFADTPCCNSKITCTKCAKSCTKPQCLDTCSKACKKSGECDKTCNK